MNNFQDVYNEKENSSSNVITTKYVAKKTIGTKWNHRDIEYNDAGIPVLRMYKNDIKIIKKYFYLNGVEIHPEIIYNTPETIQLTNKDNQYSIQTTAPTGITIGLIEGTTLIDQDFYGTINSEYVIQDTPLLIIVEKEPTIINLKWERENPVVIKSVSKNNDLFINAIYDNGDEYRISQTDLNQLEFKLSNPLIGNMNNNILVLNIRNSIMNEKTNVYISKNSINDVFGNASIELEPLTIIVNDTLDAKDLLNAKLDLEYEQILPVFDITSSYKMSLKAVYKLNDEIIWTNNTIANNYIWSSKNMNVNIDSNQTMSFNHLGLDVITATFNNYHEYSDFPESINWTVTIIKSTQNIKWNVNKSIISVGIDEGENASTISVIATYTDYSVEDIAKYCTFKCEPENIIRIDGNKIIPLEPGLVNISLMSSSITGNIIDLPKIILKVRQPVTNIDIVNVEKIVLDETELDLHVGDSKDLTYRVYPENATYDSVNWISTDESIISVDKFGHIEAKSDGYARIYATIKYEDEEVIISPTVESKIEDITSEYDGKILNESEEDYVLIEIYNKHIKDVIDKINAIGIVNASSESVIEEADVAYSNLTREQQEKVTNYYILVQAIEDFDKYKTDDSNIEFNSLKSIYGDVYAYCSINSTSIKITKLKFNRSNITLYVGSNEETLDYTIEPENATNKKVNLSFESEDRSWCISLNKEDGCIEALKEGKGILRIFSVANPEIYDEMNVEVIDNRVQKIIIDKGNDSDYEWYDDYTKSPEVVAYSKLTESQLTLKKPNNSTERTYRADIVKKHERWDDDDFSRYYCPINNSLQLSASILPSGASFADLIWYSSDGELVRCTKDGIITPVRYGNQTLDMIGEDNENDEGRRFPNTTWITAFNKKSGKAGVCQVRVTTNNITGFIIGEPDEHDYDEDIFDSDGDKKDEDSDSFFVSDEYFRHYIIWRGESITLPITIEVQDPNFGPSNNFKWYGHVEQGAQSLDEIIDMHNSTISHDNKTSEFDWTGISPTTVNENKKNLNVEIIGTGLGKVYIYPKCDDLYYAPNEVDTGITDSSGEAILGDYKFEIWWVGKINSKDKEFTTWPVQGAKITKNTANQILITTPAIIRKDTETGISNELFVSSKYSTNSNTGECMCNRIEVKCYIKESNTSNNWIPNNSATVLITSYKNAGRLQSIVDKTNTKGLVMNPPINGDEFNNTKVSGYINNYARPGEGIFKKVDNGKKIKLTVVDSPKNIYLEVLSLAKIENKNALSSKDLRPVFTSNMTLKIAYSSKRSVPMFIEFDDEFIELLNESAGMNSDECALDDKYMSFAWFTSDADVFVPIEITQIKDDRDVPTFSETWGNAVYNSNNNTYDMRKRGYKLKGYGRYMNIQPTGRGKATLTIVNIMSGKSWERNIEII